MSHGCKSTCRSHNFAVPGQRTLETQGVFETGSSSINLFSILRSTRVAAVNFLTGAEFKQKSAGLEDRESAGRRRPVVKPAFRDQIRSGDDDRNRKNRRPWWLKENETRSWRRPLERVTQKTLLLKIRRLGSYRCYLLDFRTHRSVTSGKAYREGTDGENNDCNPPPKC
jgi:hypothetical protein